MSTRNILLATLFSLLLAIFCLCAGWWRYQGKNLQSLSIFDLSVNPTEIHKRIPLSNSDTFAQQMLFHPTRGKTLETTVKPSVDTTPATTWKVYGIFSYGKQRGALISGIQPETGKKKKEVFHSGEYVGDVLLEEITNCQVILLFNGERIALDLQTGKREK